MKKLASFFGLGAENKPDDDLCECCCDCDCAANCVGNNIAESALDDNAYNGADRGTDNVNGSARSAVIKKKKRKET